MMMSVLEKKKSHESHEDETHFQLGGYVNKQNFLIWCSKNSHVILQKPKLGERRHHWPIFL